MDVMLRGTPVVAAYLNDIITMRADKMNLQKKLDQAFLTLKVSIC